ncbi:MAG: thermonuclease family protein [bacterium]|nr:thermonuclease family protein [bacterium]
MFLLRGEAPDIYASRAVVQQVRDSTATSMSPSAGEEETENVSIGTQSIAENLRTENVTIVTKSVQEDGMVLVTRVVDGDTIEIEGGEKVRYIGVNTPESVDPRRAVQCFGKEASAYNKKLILGKHVRLEPDVEDRDKYHRLLRYVWLGDTMVNEQLMQDGYAQVMTIPPNVKYADRFRVAQTQAREAKRGLWDKCKK